MFAGVVCVNTKTLSCWSYGGNCICTSAENVPIPKFNKGKACHSPQEWTSQHIQTNAKTALLNVKQHDST